MRRLARKLFRGLGFRRKIALEFIDVMIAQDIDLVLDVGANDGAYGCEIRDAGYKGQIISFEPNLTVYGRLQEKIASDPNWAAHPFALGENNGQSLLSIGENDLMSSFKSFTDFGRHTGAKQLSHQVAEIVRLDTFIRKEEAMSKNIYLKIDTQGYEKRLYRVQVNYLAC